MHLVPFPDLLLGKAQMTRNDRNQLAADLRRPLATAAATPPANERDDDITFAKLDEAV
jgi:hypothetical protein